MVTLTMFNCIFSNQGERVLMTNQKTVVFKFFLINFYFCNSLNAGGIPFNIFGKAVGEMPVVKAYLDPKKAVHDKVHDAKEAIRDKAYVLGAKASYVVVNSSKVAYVACRENPGKSAVGVGLIAGILGFSSAGSCDIRAASRSCMLGVTCAVPAYVGIDKHRLNCREARIARGYQQIRLATEGIGTVVVQQTSAVVDLSDSASVVRHQADQLHIGSGLIVNEAGALAVTAGLGLEVSAETRRDAEIVKTGATGLAVSAAGLGITVEELTKAQEGREKLLIGQHGDLRRAIAGTGQELVVGSHEQDKRSRNLLGLQDKAGMLRRGLMGVSDLVRVGK